MITVGILRINTKDLSNPHSLLGTMFYVAKGFDIELVMFTPTDIDFDSKTVNGIVLEKGKQVQKTVSIPAIIDNPILGGKYNDFVNELDKHTLLIRHSLKTSKMKTYRLLRKDGRYKYLLIPTHYIKSIDDIDIYLSKFDNEAVIKPVSGCRGRGIVKLSLENNLYQLIEKNTSYSFNRTQLESFFYNLEGTFIIQPCIHSITKQGNPFDIRIHARRGAEGNFVLHLFPRIGNPSGIVSNIAAGGYSIEITKFLKYEFGPLWKDIHKSLIQIGESFPEYYQSLYDVNIFDIGVDVGLQQSGNSFSLHIFEVNTYIGGFSIEMEDAITHLEYYRYLFDTVIHNQASSSGI